MTLNERYRAVYMRLWDFKDFCDEQHNITMRELEKELEAPQALALLRELNDALVIPGWLQPRVDAVLDQADAK
jgi:hypothetical protein